MCARKTAWARWHHLAPQLWTRAPLRREAVLEDRDLELRWEPWGGGDAWAPSGSHRVPCEARLGAGTCRPVKEGLILTKEQPTFL